MITLLALTIYSVLLVFSPTVFGLSLFSITYPYQGLSFESILGLIPFILAQGFLFYSMRLVSSKVVGFWKGLFILNEKIVRQTCFDGFIFVPFTVLAWMGGALYISITILFYTVMVLANKKEKVHAKMWWIETCYTLTPYEEHLVFDSLLAREVATKR